MKIVSDKLVDKNNCFLAEWKISSAPYGMSYNDIHCIGIISYFEILNYIVQVR